MNVLLSSVGRRAYLVEYFRKAVAPDGKVIATNCVAGTTGMSAAAVCCVVPEAGHPEYIDVLLRVCREHRVGLLFSLHDWEAPFIARAASRFESAGVRLGVSSTAVLDICLDKLKTAAFCRSHGISSPLTFPTQCEALAALAAGQVRFPLVVKARRGQGSLALYKVYSAAELAAACLLAETGLQRVANMELLSTCSPAIVIQELIHGEEYGLDVVNDFRGNFRACLAKKKTGMRSGETDAAISVDEPALHKLGAQIGACLRHTAMLDADVIVREGQPFLIDMNPRFGGHYPFSHLAGADIPAAVVAWARDEIEPRNSLTVVPGVAGMKEITVVGTSRT